MKLMFGQRFAIFACARFQNCWELHQLSCISRKLLFILSFSVTNLGVKEWQESFDQSLNLISSLPVSLLFNDYSKQILPIIQRVIFSIILLVQILMNSLEFKSIYTPLPPHKLVTLVV